MTLSKLYAKIQEDKMKLNAVDGRRFNSRSREKMEREIRVIQRNAKKLQRKSNAKKRLYSGEFFSKDELAFAKEEREKFREETDAKMKRKTGLNMEEAMVDAPELVLNASKI
ncbi:unnamed protein product [Ectocarpus sp. 12 AP-2014]